MPYYKCTQCHHEFERIPKYKGATELCDWCGAPGYILEEKTPLERMCEPKNLKKILGDCVAYEYSKSINNRKH